MLNREMASWMLLTVLAATAGCSAPARKPEVPAGPSLTVLTYNVNFGGPAPQAAVSAIARAGADIVCIQESNPDWEDLIRPALADRYPHMRFHHAAAAGGMAILSTVPLGGLEFMPATAGWFAAARFHTDGGLGRVQFLAVHLRPALSDEGEFTVSAYVRSKRTRRAEIEAFVNRLESGVPTVILGDFNENESGQAMGFLRERGYASALAQFDRSAQTWAWPVGPFTVRDRLDHILHSPQLRCFQANVIREGESDHLPVRAVLGLASPGPATRPQERRFP